MITSEDINEIVESGKVILEKMPPVHGACLYISAMLVAMINDNTDLNAKLVTGSLSVKGKTIFSHSPISKLLSLGTDSMSSWDGHAWVSVSGLVFDFSVFRTVYSEITPSDIKKLFNEIFGQIAFLVGQKNKLDEMQVIYTQAEELTDSHVTTLIQSADHMGLINC
ncbi:hypothetical protein [Vibrio echinoideorum]|uniref:Uncharacterized protein n=1 Tax=Vibrio echinoideorum TaxID=2100116 RepID=A0ABU9FXH7_9VIBR